MLSNCGARELLRVPWTAKRWNQSILRDINPEYSLEGLRLKVKLQYFGHLMRRANSLEKTLMLGKIEGRRRRGWQRMRCFDGITDSMDMSLSKLWEIVKHRETWRATVHGVTKNQTWLRDWTATHIHKFLRISKERRQSMKPNHSPSPSGSCVNAQATRLWSLPWWNSWEGLEEKERRKFLLIA